MNSLLIVVGLILGLIFCIAFLTAVWRIVNDFFVKLLNWIFSSIQSVLVLAAFIWLIWQFKH